jgi:hypothetical protein
MRLIVKAIVVLGIGAIAGTIAAFVLGPSFNLSEGELRCEGAGAVIINVAGKDYGVNAMAGPNYPLIQTIWNETNFSQVNIDRLIIHGLTLCDWQAAAN